MWKQKIVTPADVMEKIDPGMSIFLGTGMAEPRTLVRHLMESRQYNLQDLELIQLVSLGDAVAIDERYSRKFRLKTFYSGWLASDAISQGRVDLIPSRFSKVAWLFKTGAIHIAVAFIQVTPPDENGHAYLVGASVERQAMEMAQIVVGEINSQIPRTMGDTLVNMADFHYLVEATEPPYYLARWPLQERVGHRMLACVAAFGVCMIVFGLSSSFTLSLLALAVSGAVDNVSVVIRLTLMQLETPDEMRGRVAAVNTIFIGASNQLGEFESGATAALFGPVGSVVLGGIGTLLVAAGWIRLFPDLAQRDRMK